MAKKATSFIQVYCPELMAMINPGEWTDCPFFRGQKLDISNTEEALKQIFRCHVQCDCKIQYQYYDGGKLVEKVVEVRRGSGQPSPHSFPGDETIEKSRQTKEEDPARR